MKVDIGKHNIIIKRLFRILYHFTIGQKESWNKGTCLEEKREEGREGERTRRRRGGNVYRRKNISEQKGEE